MERLNIGCGPHFHTEWTNIDIVSSSPDVQAWDIRKGLPYPNESFDACYHSHVLEHLVPQEAELLIEECFRVLKANGIIRVVVPDLESITRNYLKLLEEVDSGKGAVEADYDWMMLEMCDQTVRVFSGGEMGRYLRNPRIPNRDFVRSRMGFIVEEISNQSGWKTQSTPKTWKSQLARIFSKSLGSLSKCVSRDKLSKILVGLIAGREAKRAFEEVLFRDSGEVHRWMYDRYSLRRLLKNAGFSEMSVCRADESRIPDFNRCGLDMLGGKVRKADSLFMEAIKP